MFLFYESLLEEKIKWLVLGFEGKWIFLEINKAESELICITDFEET